MAPSWSSPAPGRGRRASSWSACAGSWRPRAPPDRHRRPDPRGTHAPARQPLRRPPRPGAAPGPDLQRQGREGAPGAPGPGRGPGDPRPHDRQQLPQLLPARPHRVRRRRGPAGAPGRPGRRRPAPPAPGPQAQPGPALPHGLRLPGLRGLHQPGQGRAGRTRTTSTRFVAERAPGLRGPLRELRGGRPAPRGPGQPRAPAQGARRLREACARTSARRTPASCASTTPAMFVQGHGPRGPPLHRR